MISRVIKKTVDLDAVQKVDQLEGPLYQLEESGHTFEITCMSGGTAAAVSGTVSGRFLRADETTVYFTGTLSGNVASLTLPQSCYNVNGRFGLVVFVSGDDVTSAIYAVAGNVYRSTSDTIIDPTGEIPSLEELMAQIEACEEATASAQQAASFVNSIIAPTYSTGVSYAIGDYCTYEGSMYRATAATSGAFDSNDWEMVLVGGEFKRVNEDVDDLKNAMATLMVSWEQGTYSQGAPGSSSKRIRTIGAFRTAYPFTVKAISGYGYNVFYGDDATTKNQYYNEWQTGEHTYTDTTKYYRITASHNDQSNIYPTETPVIIQPAWEFYTEISTRMSRAAYIEKSGFFTWQAGNINESGTDVTGNNRIRTKGSYAIATDFVVSVDTGYKYNVYASAAGGTPIPLYTGWQTAEIVFEAESNKIYRFTVAKSDDSSISAATDSVHFHFKTPAANDILVLQDDTFAHDQDYFTWERGTIDSTGSNNTSTTRIRTSGTYTIPYDFKVSVDAGYGYNVFMAEPGGSMAALFSEWQTDTKFYQNNTGRTFRFSMARIDQTTIRVVESEHFHISLPNNAVLNKTTPMVRKLGVGVMAYDAWFRTYSHRIDPTMAPMNTLSACKSAYALGYRWFETDIRLTSDSVPVICHDATINATSDGEGSIADMTYEQLQAYDFGSWFSKAFEGEKILTLDTLCKFAYTHNVGLSLEMKNDVGWTAETAQIVYNIIKNNNMLGRVVWNNQYTGPMSLMKEIDPDQDFCFFSGPSASNIATAAGYKTPKNRVELAGTVSQWTSELVASAKASGLICLAYNITNGTTENLTLAQFKTMIGLGIGSTLVQGINIRDWEDQMFEDA